MKHFTLIATAALALLAGCQEKISDELTGNEQTKPTVDRTVITAGIPEKLSKVSMNVPEDGIGLALAWEAGDELTVIGNTTETFVIKEGFTAHKAEFNGAAVEGDSFTILYPGSEYKTLENIKSVSFLDQTQKGNANVEHIFYQAMIETTDYTNLDFSKAKQSGVIKFLFQLPESATTVNSITLSATSDIFFTTNDLDGQKVSNLTLNLEDVDVSASERMLTAYMMLPWHDIAIAGGSKLTVTVEMPDSRFVQVLDVPENGLTILAGKVNVIGLNDKSWTEPLFFGGNGTEADPYQIKSYTHLDNVRKVINADTKTWFKMVDDIDMTGKDWTMYNGGIDNEFKYDFDGNDKTISNFSMTRSGASFFGAITGGSKVHDLKFNKVELSGVDGGSNSVGTVSYNIIDGTVDNVDITDATITSSTSNGNNTGTGAIASRLYKGAISNCDVVGLTMNTTAERVAGIVGVNATNGNTIENCTVTDASISGKYCTAGIVGRSSSTPTVIIKNCKLLGTNTISSTSIAVGGILGENGGGASIEGCKVNASLTTSWTASSGDKAAYIGGIIGYAKGNATVEQCTVSGNVTTDKSNARVAGGIIGGSDQNNTYKIQECAYLGGEIISGGRAGGIMGWIKYAVTVENCYSTGTMRNATWSGGILGWHNGNGSQGSVKNCYSTMTITTTGNGIGGIVGCFDSGSTTRSNDNTGTISGCIAWNTSIASTNSCSGCVTGGSGKASSISNCYRNPSMITGFTVSEPTDNTSASANAGKPYHVLAAAADATVSSIAKTLGWSADIWDFTTDLPTLKNLPK